MNTSFDVKLEIGHVLFIDIVGYSKLLINQQIEQLETLKNIVRGTEQFRLAQDQGKLLGLPSGDGGALVFRTSPEAPLLCAVEIAKELKKYPELKVRMGIHSGPVNEITDLNEQANIAGAGINIAQRVMDCGDAGHILLSRHVAEDLENYTHWQPYLHPLGECEVKHGTHVGIVNFYGDGIGNPTLPKKLQTVTHRHSQIRRAAIAVALLLVSAIVATFFAVSKRIATSAALDKSIAVLPFARLSDDKNDAYFADGVQDQILTNLAKVSDLKVISHTSVRQYKTGAERNMREIGRQLGVAYIMEGSVQRARDRIRINAKLIDARRDAQIWAETYDRTAGDLFAVQSELAQSIVTQLKAKLSPEQKAQIEERPTQDLDAFELYLQAKAIIDSYINATDVRAALLQALKSLEEAIQRDPNFVSAYCYAARANDLLFFFDLDPTQDRISMADAAVKAALRLRPDSAEAHFARADYYFRCLRDYDRAQEELAIARPGLPNSSPFFILSGYITRRRNHFAGAERDFSTAFALDPRNPNAYNLLADTYVLQRRFPEAVHVYDNVLSAGEETPIVQFRRASCILWGTGDTGPMRHILTRFPDMEFAGGQTPVRSWMAILDGNYAEAECILTVSARQDFQDIDFSFYFPKSWYQAMVARAKGDSARATAAFRECREILAQRLVVKPEHARTIAVLAQVDAGLGQKDLAIREAQHAIDLMPISKDIYDGALALEGLAQVYVWIGDRDEAIELLQKLVSIPGYTNYGRLKLHPLWSPLRGDARFEEIVNALAPK